MNHPTPEEWMSYLYDELPPTQHEAMTGHLDSCPDCQASVQQWRGVMRDLDTCAAPRRARPASVWANTLKWGVAALLMLGIGFGWGRFVAPARVDVPALRAEIELSLKASLQADLRRQLQNGLDRLAANSTAETQRLINQFEKANKTERESDRQGVIALLKEMETQRLSDYTTLRKDLETVALVAEEKLNYAQQQIGQLASYTQPAGTTGLLQK